MHVRVREAYGKLLLVHAKPSETAHQTLQMIARLREHNAELVKEKGIVGM